MAGCVHDLENSAPQPDRVPLIHQPGGVRRGKRIVAWIESLEWDRVDQHLWQLVIVVLYLRSPGHREVAREEAGELAVPGQEFLLPQMNESFPEFVHAPDVIVVSVSCDRDHPLAGAREPAEYPGQWSNPGTRVHDQISILFGRGELGR